MRARFITAIAAVGLMALRFALTQPNPSTAPLLRLNQERPTYRFCGAPVGSERSGRVVVEEKTGNRFGIASRNQAICW
jgi:hypothetical protein